jgi:hypothetical protein
MGTTARRKKWASFKGCLKQVVKNLLMLMTNYYVVTDIYFSKRYKY